MYSIVLSCVFNRCWDVGEVVEARDEGEKKSGLKKVKDKANKIKHTIKKHAHLHHNHNHHVHQSTNLVEESNTVPNNSPANLPHSTSTATEKRSDDGLNSRSNPLSEGEDSRDTMAGKVSSSSTGAVADKPNASKSMKQYLWEKLKPGDDDKALSEAITHAFQKKGKRGKVTVSKEVAERLGTTQENKREGEDALAAGEHSTGQGVAERLQNAFTSWLSKSNGIQTAQDSIANARF